MYGYIHIHTHEPTLTLRVSACVGVCRWGCVLCEGMRGAICGCVYVYKVDTQYYFAILLQYISALWYCRTTAIQAPWAPFTTWSKIIICAANEKFHQFLIPLLTICRLFEIIPTILIILISLRWMVLRPYKIKIQREALVPSRDIYISLFTPPPSNLAGQSI